MQGWYIDYTTTNNSLKQTQILELYLYFQVSSPVFLKCNVIPKSAYLQQNHSILGHLTVKALLSAEPQSSRRVTVSAVSSTENTEKVIFTLEVTIQERRIVENEKEREKEMAEAEKEMGFFLIIGIVLAVLILLALILFVMCLRNKRKRGSWTVWKSKHTDLQKVRVRVEISKSEKSVSKPEIV